MKDQLREFEKRKRDMMELWKDTFHDSQSYINLVFDTYFSLDNTFVRYKGETLISALLGVPYTFQAYDKYKEKILMKGFYLCGLATNPKWRKRGIMSHLMEKAEISAKERGYDMTFLIPADDNLREYYNKKGYHTASYRKRQTIDIPLNAYKDAKSEMYIYTIRDFLTHGKTSFIDQLAEWCCEIERKRKSFPTILHSRKDMLTIMAENENSIFLTDYTFDPEYPILANVSAVVFPELPTEEEQRIKIIGLYSERILCYSKINIGINTTAIDNSIMSMITSISHRFHKSKIEFLLPNISNTFENREEEPYAMIKPMRNIDILDKNENQKFEISLMLD